ncbi:TonB-like protein [Sphingomonas paucimobilis]|nr:TonB-like protein [Sphingomonas paucimobilis]
MKSILAGGGLLILAACPAFAREPVGPTPRASPGSWFSDKDYPTSESAKGASGTAAFNLLVQEDGGVKDCRIVQSSGSPALDATTCALLKERASFYPARDGKGRKIESIYSGRITWRLPAGSVVLFPEPQTLIITVDISSEGVVEKCSSVKSGEFEVPVDPCMRYPVGLKGRVYAGPDGKPVAARYIERITHEMQSR